MTTRQESYAFSSCVSVCHVLRCLSTLITQHTKHPPLLHHHLPPSTHIPKHAHILHSNTTTSLSLNTSHPPLHPYTTTRFVIHLLTTHSAPHEHNITRLFSGCLAFLSDNDLLELLFVSSGGAYTRWASCVIPSRNRCVPTMV